MFGSKVPLLGNTQRRGFDLPRTGQKTLPTIQSLYCPSICTSSSKQPCPLRGQPVLTSDGLRQHSHYEVYDSSIPAFVFPPPPRPRLAMSAPWSPNICQTGWPTCPVPVSGDRRGERAYHIWSIHRTRIWSMVFVCTFSVAIFLH